MGRASRSGLLAALVLLLVPSVITSCASARRSPAAEPSEEEPIPTSASEGADGGPCGGGGAIDEPATDPVPDDGIAGPLEPFASHDDLLAWATQIKATPPAASAGDGMWGDAIGDAFGAGGLGLSGIGEGGGGFAQQFGMIGLLPSSSPWARDGANDSITNNQHASVDEGGIVKVHGDHFVVLRRGRLFTVRTDDLSPVAVIDAFAPGVDPAGTWYDEMLVSGDTIAVVGYSHARGGTEIGLFDIDAAGQLRSRATYQLRSNDYYSSRNYASRLVGTKLVFYTPLYLQRYGADALGWVPALRRWTGSSRGAPSTAHRGRSSSDDFEPIATATSIHRPLFTPRPGEPLALHTVTTCDLSDVARMKCSARGVIAGAGRAFYVSPDAVYVWTSRSQPHRTAPALVYRMPFDERAEPGVVRAAGSPIDQLSFLEDDTGNLDVLVTPNGEGEAMWGAEIASAALALVRVPLSAFTGEARVAPRSAYTKLPSPKSGPLQNRFVGKHLLYATGYGWGRPGSLDDNWLHVTRFGERGAPTFSVPVNHAVDRIEVLGDDAIAVGPDPNALHFTSIALPSHGAPHIAGRYSRPGAAQGELRTHGFFYRSDGEREGWLGLPIRGGGAPGADHLSQPSARVLFVKNEGLRLSEAGTLSTSARGELDNDRCVASCVDWYGNARPIFFRGRVFALLGYEMVEGRLGTEAVEETRRTSFSPRR